MYTGIRNMQYHSMQEYGEKHMRHTISDQNIAQFSEMLKNHERSDVTIRKYTRDVLTFRQWLGDDKSFDKVRIMQYKEELQKKYKTNSTNSMLSALNTFLLYMGWSECKVSTLKVQRSSFRTSQKDLTKEEFARLLKVAREKGKEQLLHIMETIAATGIRVGELPYITVEALNTGRAVVTLKRKTREILLPSPLCKVLRKWCHKKGIKSGSIFVTRNGNPVDRTNILHMMKSLAGAANVLCSKIFPHNHRHLFAVNYYENEKDIVRLADLLGHSNINTTRIYTMTTGERELTSLNRVADTFILVT